MIEQAKELVSQIKELKKNASSMLAEAVSTGDLLLAWGVFETLEDQLPVKSFIIRETEYPLLRKNLNDYGYFDRHQDVMFSSYLEEEIWAVENPKEIPEHMTNFVREHAEAMMWEVLKNGYAGFTYDW